MPTDRTPPAFLTVPQIARTYGYSQQTVIRWLTAGVRGVRLAGFKVGGHWRVSPGAWEDFLAAGESATEIPPEPRRRTRHNAGHEALRLRLIEQGLLTA